MVDGIWWGLPCGHRVSTAFPAATSKRVSAAIGVLRWCTVPELTLGRFAVVRSSCCSGSSFYCGSKPDDGVGKRGLRSLKELDPGPKGLSDAGRVYPPNKLRTEQRS